MLDRLWEAVDADKQGGLSEDELLHGLGGAFSRSRAARLRWHWQTFYDTGLRGELGAHAIFALLSQVSSRLEDDAMLLCRLASAKLSHGQRAAVTLEEYTAHYASAPEDEPDALGLRRRALPPRQHATLTLTLTLPLPLTLTLTLTLTITITLTLTITITITLPLTLTRWASSRPASRRPSSASAAARVSTR